MDEVMKEWLSIAIGRVQIPIMRADGAMVGVQQVSLDMASLIAEAVLRTMLTPTPTMIQAGVDESGEELTDVQVRDVYQAMLTAALQEPV